MYPVFAMIQAVYRCFNRFFVADVAAEQRCNTFVRILIGDQLFCYLTLF